MAEIRIVAMSHSVSGGPDMPLPLHATLGKQDIGGREVNVLQMTLGHDHVAVWPADPEYIRNLGKRLLKIADELDENV